MHFLKFKKATFEGNYAVESGEVIINLDQVREITRCRDNKASIIIFFKSEDETHSVMVFHPFNTMSSLIPMN